MLLEEQIGIATLKNSLPIQIHFNPVNSTPRILPKCVRMCSQRPRMFKAGLSVIAPKWNQPKFVTIEEGIHCTMLIPPSNKN